MEEERIFQRCIPEPNSGCWLWTGTTAAHGYGKISIRKKFIPAHRASWMFFKGAIPLGMEVCHRCDVRCCVNPDHLFLGSHRANMDDAKAKGRIISGDKHHNSKLTKEQVLYIQLSNEKVIDLAERFGVSKAHISNIRNGKRRRSR